MDKDLVFDALLKARDGVGGFSGVGVARSVGPGPERLAYFGPGYPVVAGRLPGRPE